MDIVNRFLNFDKLIGSGLVKFVYFAGLILIAIAILFSMFSGFGLGFLQGIGTLILAPLFGLVMVLFWRFYCELMMVMFKISNDLADIKAVALKTPTTP